jgi:hypothetical protein
VELNSRLSAQLSTLALGVSWDGRGLTEQVSTLGSALADAVSGYAGLRLTIMHRDHPVQVTSLAPGAPSAAVVTSLRVLLRPAVGAADDGVRLVVWSTVLGALVDLGADLAHVLDGPPGSPAPSAVALDDDLPLRPTTSGVEGLEQLATINRAAGVLIARGHDPGSVHEAMREGAARDGSGILAWAERVLGER